MRQALAKLLQRFVCILAVHASFLALATSFLMIASVSAEQPEVGVVSLTLVSIFVLIPWILVILVTLTAPSAVYSSLIYLIGGFFNETAAMVIAALVGTVVMYFALSSSYPADKKFPLPITWKITLTAIYALCWIAVRKLLPRFV